MTARILSRLLLAGGVVGPLLFILVFLVEGLTRPDYSAWRNFVSQLATGPGGWVQTINFFVCGVLVVGLAVGLRLAAGGVATPALVAAFGVSLLVAGAFTTDPALGYPPGAPLVHTSHGMIHGLAGLGAFSLLPAAAITMAVRFARDGTSRRWFWYSLVVGVVIIACFIASTTFSTLDQTGTLPNAPTGFLQRIAIVAGWTWLSMLALHFLRGGDHH
jgi:Protein of unknown function (DUF998)